jgi:hypothetical protein
MTQTLQYRLEQNQAQQQSLNEKFYRQRDRASQKAILWIQRKESETAAALVDKKASLIFQELCRVYNTQPWKLSENELFLNFIFLPERARIQSVSCKNKQKEFLTVLISVLLPTLFLMVVGAVISYDPEAFKLYSITVSIGITLYLLSIIIRVILKVYVVRKNLVWYAPICSFYQFQNRYETDIKQLKENEKKLQETLQNIDLWDSERFRDDAEWFYKALKSAPPKKKKRRRL